MQAARYRQAAHLRLFPMQTTRTQPTVFLSYSHEDKSIARELARELEKRGAEVWFDEQTLRLGDSLLERISAAIRSSDVFLILVSPASGPSEWMRRELSAALATENKTRVIPIRLAGAEIPTDLSNILYLDADPHDLGAAADQVLQSSGPPAGELVEQSTVTEIEQVLSRLGLTWQREPAIAGVRPDFLVEAPDGKRLIIEAKGRSNPGLLAAVDARSQAARFRELTGADDAVAVFPHIMGTPPTAGIVGLAELTRYLQEFLTAPPTGPRIATGRPTPGPSSDKRIIFASMPFKPQYEDVYWVAMTAAAEAVGATCVRVDREDFDGDIPAKIKDYIESSIAVIADLSESNADVLYEIGYARRHGCPCVHICSTPLDELPFNVRNINTLPYKQGQIHELREPLSERLRAAINGEHPDKS
jgi:hypothetical protein